MTQIFLTMENKLIMENNETEIVHFTTIVYTIYSAVVNVILAYIEGIWVVSRT